MTDYELDASDRELLRLLQADGRAPFTEPAAKVGLSVPTAKRRVDRLRALGVITGFTAQIDYSKRVRLEMSELLGGL